MWSMKVATNEVVDVTDIQYYLVLLLTSRSYLDVPTIITLRLFCVVLNLYKGSE
jgi:hypothetical protein